MYQLTAPRHYQLHYSLESQITTQYSLEPQCSISSPSVKLREPPDSRLLFARDFNATWKGLCLHASWHLVDVKYHTIIDYHRCIGTLRWYRQHDNLPTNHTLIPAQISISPITQIVPFCMQLVSPHYIPQCIYQPTKM